MYAVNKLNITSARMKLFICVAIYVCLSLVQGEEDGELFDNDVHYIEPETGGKLYLQSKGKFASIIDLDVPAVKRVLCKESKILVALNKDGGNVTSWKPGQLIIGSEKWRCYHNVLKPESMTIYAKVAAVKHPKDYVIELHTTEAGPLDIFEEADIRVQYEQGASIPSRHRRYLSNPLYFGLNQMDYVTAFTSNIPFNLNNETMVEHEINVYKNTGPVEPSVDTKSNTSYDEDKDFLLRCFDCHGHSDITFNFHLKINNVDKKAVVKKYLMTMDIRTHAQQNISLYTDKEIALTKTASLLTSAPSTIFQTELAMFKTLPPITLTVNYTSQANTALKASTKSAAQYQGDFSMDGRIYISQSFEEGSEPENDVSVFDWNVTSSHQHVDTNGTMNATFTFFQNMTITPALSWSLRDVDMDLGPPIRVSTRPTLSVISSSDTVARCHETSVSIDSNISVPNTDLGVQAYGFDIWNVRLMKSLTRKFDILRQPLLHMCHADCHGPEELRADDTMESACLEPSGPIVRGDSRFYGLHQLWGDYVLFSSEEASATWCGDVDRPCVNCSHHVIGNSEDSSCADRLMNFDLATSVTRLAKFVEVEWPDRKILVLEAWDEPTSDFPEGRHGNVSVFYEGRAAEISLTKPLTKASDAPEIENDEYILERLTELAVCSNFAYVKRDNSSVSMCVENRNLEARKKRSLLSRTRRSGHVEHSMVKEMLEELGTAVEASVDDLGSAPNLALYEAYPSNTTMEAVCGPFTGTISQDDPDRFRRLVEYPLSNAEFESEGPADTWCGVETRQCQDCTLPSDDLDDHWTWCGTRTMHMRLAAGLQRLSTITNQQVKVNRALSMKEPENSSKLFEEGRAALISMVPGSSFSMDEFASKAILAGFDHVKYASENYLEVCVKLQDGMQATVVSFPLAKLIAVPLPVGEEDEYDYPEVVKKETRKPLLFDFFTSPDIIGIHFRLSNFVSPGRRYVRIDPVLVNLLDLGYNIYHGGFYVISGSGYRPRSVNNDNIATRHEKEIIRYRMGQAVEIKPNMPTNNDMLFDLGLAMIKVARTVRMRRIGVGIGCKTDRLYFEIRPMDKNNSKSIDVWESGNVDLFNRLKEIEYLVSIGGTVVTATFDPVICKESEIGSSFFYFSFDLEEEGPCNAQTEEFCEETREDRKRVGEDLQKVFSRVAGSDRLPRKDIVSEIQKCIVDTCGGCPSTGAIWKQKVIKCAKMVSRFLERASTPYPPLVDKVTIFNTENLQSSVHSLACHDGNICIENTKLYAILEPTIAATYEHEHTTDLLFAGSDNPSPLLEIAEQELAWRAEGNVNVFIESMEDLSALSNTLKIIMMYNRKINNVTFHITDAASKDNIYFGIHELVAQWSGSVCPRWSRLVSTPYRLEIIPHDRKKRSAERSQQRNQMKLDMRHWEVNWLLKS